MKHIVYVVSVFIVLLLAGCTMETQKEDNKTKDNLVDITIEESVGNEMSVHFIDVGQGDSILIQSPKGKRVG